MSSNFKLKRISDGKEYELSETSILVGRSESCDIQITEGHPSREHARVAERDGAVLVQDLHSTNGTFVNNQKIATSAVLSVGDVVKFGDESFSVQSLTEPEATVLMRSLGAKGVMNASVIDDDEDEDDEDSTSILEVYSMPPGWDDSAPGFASEVGKLDERKKNAIDRYIEKFSQSLKGKKGLFLIFFSDDNPPVFKSVIIKDDKNAWSFGRSEECDICFDNPCISKYHADISVSSSGWAIEDKDSTNGISHEGVQSKTLQLVDDMVIEISVVEVLVRFIKA